MATTSIDIPPENLVGPGGVEEQVMPKAAWFDFVVADLVVVALIVLGVLAFLSWMTTTRSRPRARVPALLPVPVSSQDPQRQLLEEA